MRHAPTPPTALLTPDLCVIGGGSGGLSVAAGAVRMGASVVLIEKGAMGGECLNAGCVPSKALLAAARAAQTAREARRFGIEAAVTVDFPAVAAHVRATIAAIAPNDSVARFESLGVTVLRGAARFTGPREVVAAGTTVRARRFIVATGSSPLIPAVPGIEDVPYLTNETLFSLDAAPEHLIVLGGGAMGLEMAQAHRRLGGAVTVIDAAPLLSGIDADLVAVLRQRLTTEGVILRDGVTARAVTRTADGAIALAVDGETLIGSHLLIAAGRRANVDGLGLDAAGIAHDGDGIAVDRRLRTSNRRVFAIGDVTADGRRFTHVAAHHAAVVIKNALFRWPAVADRAAVPRVLFTDPELAVVGLSENEAKARFGDGAVSVLMWPFADNDRARCEARPEGLIKALVHRDGRILGCGIVGPRAGELIQSWTLAIDNGLKISALATTIAPYPTFGEISKRAAGSFFAPRLFGPGTRRLVRFLSRFG